MLWQGWQEVLEDIFEKKYEEDNDEFIKLIHTYTSYRDDTPLKELVLKINNYIQSNPFPEKWLTDKIEMFNLKDRLDEDFANTIWGKELLKEVRDKSYPMSKDYKLFEVAYRKQLETKSNISNFVDEFGKYENVVLLCSEPTNEKCHRRVLSEMLLKKFGNDIKFGGNL